ncbi:MAG TPA: heavy metal-associated domain-containing protein [Candidatus Methanomethylophilaceae archaeon]|nr:heavy metal-associated domain-containing protein [Candidatus Methanomethylophilaceae archaeon]
MSNTNLKIQGMTCGSCSAKVEEALKSVDGVTDVTVDHRKGSARITHNDSISTEKLIRTVVDAGYRAEVKRGLFK